MPFFFFKQLTNYSERAKGIIGRIFPKSIFADTETRNKMRPPTSKFILATIVSFM